MSESVVNNKLIVKNTIFLYLRMLVVMIIGLYTVRAFLSILGETDYGLYNVIGGVVGMFSFLSSTLATSSQRYFSQVLVKNDVGAINKVFCLNLTVFIIILVIIVVFLETVGLWFVNTQMTIPSERMSAANAVYQISIVTFILQMITVSYNALIISHERMKAFAYIGIFEAVMKLFFVILLTCISFDKLISYAFLFLFLYLIIALVYILYSRRNFEESKFHFYWNKQEAYEMLGFSGWHLLGTLSVVVRSQGVNILLNMFFNPAVNAARAVAFQVEGAINRFSDSFFVAVKPQMYKSYSNGELIALNKLVLRSSIICFFLVSILSIPIYFNLPLILDTWLKDVPLYTVSFTKLVIIEGLIDSISVCAICPALATGKIKKFYIITGTLYLLVLPISFVLLRMGFDPTSTMIVSISISVVALFIRARLLVGLIQLEIKAYYWMVMRLAAVTILTGSITFASLYLFDNQIIDLVFSVFVSSVLHVFLYLFCVFPSHDRNVILTTIKNKLHTL